MHTRREWLRRAGVTGIQLASGLACAAPPREIEPARESQEPAPATRGCKLFLCGDVMTGRGIDQVLAHPSRPHLHEDYVRSARDYVAIAESRSGPIPRGVPPPYIWGDALEEMRRAQPDVRAVNLETSITTSEDAEPKGIHYRMHPANVSCLTAAGLDCCVLANNHVLDWGRAGLAETLETLRSARIQTAGAGRDLAEAQRPAVMDVCDGGRVLIYGIGGPDCGIPPTWAATPGRPGVNFLADYSPRSAESVASGIAAVKRPGDLVVVSIHWGPNWGYHIPETHRAFARRLVDAGVADAVHGHSSHHPKGIEVYRKKAILYGCGDFLNDYEGIGGHEQFRGDLALAFFLTLGRESGELLRLEMKCFQLRRFQLRRAARRDQEWLREMLNREGRELGSHFVSQPGGGLALG